MCLARDFGSQGGDASEASAVAAEYCELEAFPHAAVGQIADLQAVTRQHGVDWRHQKSSHCVFVRDDGRTLSVPAHRPIKPIYIRKFVELIDGA